MDSKFITETCVFNYDILIISMTTKIVVLISSCDSWIPSFVYFNIVIFQSLVWLYCVTFLLLRQFLKMFQIVVKAIIVFITKRCHMQTSTLQTEYTTLQTKHYCTNRNISTITEFYVNWNQINQKKKLYSMLEKYW